MNAIANTKQHDVQRAAPPRRVALVSEWCLPRKGGIESHILALAKALQARGIETTIVTSYPGPEEIEGVRVDRVDCLRLPILELAVSPRLIGIIAERLAAGRYDTVHIQPSIVAPFCFAAAPAAHALGLPVAMTFHSVMRNLPRLLRLFDRSTGWFDKRVTMSAVSAVVARPLREAFPDRPVHILPNGFDWNFWAARAPESRTREVLRMVTALRLERRKRPGALVDIFGNATREARRRGLTLELTIAGDGLLRNRVERQIARQELSGNVRLAGWRSPGELRDLYRQSDLFVMPSIKESFCIAALEARAAGLPVLARAGTGIADYISHGLSGLLAETDSELAHMMVDLAADRGRIERLATGAEYLDRYDWRHVAEEHVALYRGMHAPNAVTPEIPGPA